MDWIHCNNCTIQPGDEDGKKFLTTSCGHIYCEDCTLLPELKQCRVCQSSYQTMPLTSKMSKEVELYFRNPIDDIQKFVRVLEFQQSHRLRLASINKEKLEKYGCLKKENSVLKEGFKRLEKENAFLREENKRFNEALAEYKRKIECLRDCQESRNTPVHASSCNGFDAFPKTPKLMKSDSGIGTSLSHCNVFKRPPEKQNFFVMSSAKGSQPDRSIFHTPTLPKMPGSFRSLRTLASDLNSPTSSKLSSREILSQQRDLHCRRVKLPGDRGGPSPATSAFRRLALSKLSSLPKNCAQSSKYSHYFNKV